MASLISSTTPLAKKVTGSYLFAVKKQQLIEKIRLDYMMDGEGKLCFKNAEEFCEIFNIMSSSKQPPKGSDDKPARRNMFKNVYATTMADAVTVKKRWREDKMYDTFIAVVEDNKLCPGYEFTSSTDKGDKDDLTKQRVDMAMYKATAPTDGAPHWDDQALWIEFKRDRDLDPFKKNTLVAKGLKRVNT